jgi:hypothetical protein
MASPLRSLISWVLAVVACALTVVAIGATWMHHQLLNSGAYTEASVRVLRVHSVQNLTAKLLADEVVAQQDQVRAALPAALQGLTGAATTALADAAQKAALAGLRDGTLEPLWRTASRDAHTQFVHWLADEPTGAKNAAVELDLQPIIERIAKRVGISDALIAQEREATGGAAIALLKPGQYDSTRTDARRLGQAATATVPLAVLVALVSIVIAPRRRWGFVRVGIAAAAAGGVVVLAAPTARTHLIDGLVDGGAARPVAVAIWDATSPALLHVGWYAVIAGLALAAVAIVTAPRRRAPEPPERARRSPHAGERVVRARGGAVAPPAPRR